MKTKAKKDDQEIGHRNKQKKQRKISKIKKEIEPRVKRLNSLMLCGV